MLSLQVECYILAIMDKSQFLRAERGFFFVVRLNFQYCQHRHQITSVIQSPLLQELELLKENVHVYRKVTDWFTMSSVEITCLGQ